MSSLQPLPAVEAFAGKSYEFRGRKIRNTNAAMLALCAVGIPMEAMREHLVDGAPVIVWAMCEDSGKVFDMLSEPARLRGEALRFCAEFTPEEMGEAVAIFIDALKRFEESATRYVEKLAVNDSGNSRAA